MSTEVEGRPWATWPAIAKAARANGWRILAERRGVARLERRDPRSEVGAVTLHVEFNRAGHIAGAWIEELDRNIRSQPKKLNTILQWISEAVPVKHAPGLASVLGPYWDEVEWDDEGESWWDPIEGRWVR